MPVALTIVFALSASLLLSLTVIPVLASWLLKQGAHSDSVAGAQSSTALYRPVAGLVAGHTQAGE